MDIGPIFFKEIDFMISLKNGLSPALVRHLRFGKEKSRSGFSLPKVGPMSILQKAGDERRAKTHSAEGW
jgi:hypothetical protein